LELKRRDMRLDGKIALVTGAGRGIGAGIAEAFAAAGAKVWVTDLDAPAAKDVASRIGINARTRALDVRDGDSWRAAEQAILADDGRLDVLVNNAGITGLEDGAPQDVANVALESWRAVLATNLDGVVLGCQMAIRAMRPGGGSIINIASRSGHLGIPAAAAYAASKAAVINHTRSVALYCAERDLNIRCNSISPAAMLTPMWEPMLGDGPDREARMAECVADTPLRRFGTPAEVAALAVLLASDAASYMTGSDLTLDGGLLAGTVAQPKPA
jgi:3(or 17)beta-hydroxysteroid dehydrogenase